MTDNPLAKLMERLMGMAQMHDTVYCKVVWDKNTETFSFTPLLKEFVEVSFEGKKHD